ncbi:MAG: SAM-dependent chlorinase/fluorinase [Deltaproteobacteria bacterium]|nr:SAM-dependent chlorinase/fluorinase [Deltaproteobacteria bacterium]
MAVVTLLSDFGTQDGFVGAMKGVILRRASSSQLVDLTHELRPQDVHAGAWALREAAATFPPGTIHLAVVDPGVGTTRQPLLLVQGGQRFVGPDNGLLTLAAPQPQAAYVLDRPELHQPVVSSTFHGRDLFASVAGHLAAGLAPELCGRPAETWIRLCDPTVERRGRALVGEVVHVDRFGNLVTNLTGDLLGDAATWEVTLAELRVGPLVVTYGQVPSQTWLAYVGSSGRVELAVRDGSAAARGYARGTRVTLVPAPSPVEDA